MRHDSNFKIIVIDDNPAIHLDFIKILKKDTPASALESLKLDSLKKELFGETIISDSLPNFEIDFASQGKEGVTRIEEALDAGKPYSLAFVDIRMPPGWDGIETIKHIWQVDPDIQIVICTAYSDYSWEETVAHLGKTDNLLILKKPFDNISVRQLAFALTRKWKLTAEARNYTASLQDQVNERTEKLEYLANHDPLTGLVNRIKLLENIRFAIQNAQRNNLNFSVLFLDLDRFKLINDSLSHNTGDEILTAVAQRLQTSIRAEDTLARIGGDEFVIVLLNINKEKNLLEKLDKIISSFHDPFIVEKRKIKLSTSIGVSQFPRDGKTAEELLRNADIAMYRAKAHKGNNFQIFTPEMSMESIAALDQEIELQQAIANDELFLVYQPQISLIDEKLEAVEALIRWRHPTKGVLLPIDFIPRAEETGMIVPITEWVIRKACEQNKHWQKMGFPPIRIAVNITAQFFKEGNLVEYIRDTLNETQLKPEYLELELTENVILSHHEIIKTVRKLKKLGVIIAVDDFGTGYSSLSYLHKIPLDRLKIDSSFIQHIKSATDDEVIIRAVIAMAKNLNLQILAEGVETIDQLNFLKQNKCEDVQGFYFSKPLTETELENYFKHPVGQKSIAHLIDHNK